MGQYINKKTVIDSETGELIKEKLWVGFDGFSENGFRYRNRVSTSVKFFPDSLPPNLSSSATLLLHMIGEIMNNDNVLVYKVERKSKFSSIIYKPMDKEDIMERIRFKYGKNKFNTAWRELQKQCIKKIKYYDMEVYAINPAIINKCKYVPFWLYEEFQNYMNPYLSAITIKKLQAKLNDLNF